MVENRNRLSIFRWLKIIIVYILASCLLTFPNFFGFLSSFNFLLFLAFSPTYLWLKITGIFKPLLRQLADGISALCVRQLAEDRRAADLPLRQPAADLPLRQRLRHMSLPQRLRHHQHHQHLALRSSPFRMKMEYFRTNGKYVSIWFGYADTSIIIDSESYEAPSLAKVVEKPEDVDSVEPKDGDFVQILCEKDLIDEGIRNKIFLAALSRGFKYAEY